MSVTSAPHLRNVNIVIPIYRSQIHLILLLRNLLVAVPRTICKEKML